MDQAEKLRNMIKEHKASSALEEENSGARVITITSGKGGVGKSSTAVNLAVQFRKLGYRVMIFDADFGLANIEVMFGAIPKYNLSDVVYRGKELSEIIVEGPMGINFISGGSGVFEMTNMSTDNLRYLIAKLNQLESMADIIIIDTGAGISESVLQFITSCSEVILITTPEPTSITDSYALLKALNRHPDYDKDNTSVKVITNKVKDEDECNTLFSKLSIVTNKFLQVDISLLGMIPQDTHIVKSVMQQQPVSIAYEDSDAAKAYEVIAKRLTQAEEEKVSEKRGISAIFAKLFKAKS